MGGRRRPRPLNSTRGMAVPRALLALLLAAASAVHLGEALSCITCEQPTALPLCKNITYCKPDEIACKTTLVTVEAEFPFNESPVVTSTCASSCEATDPDSIGAAHPIFCCFHDLCNSVGVARLSAGALAPLGAVVLSHLLP